MHALLMFLLVETGAEREVWGRSRAMLCRGAHGSANLASLVEIQSCAFVLCLDDGDAAEGPRGMVERARACWHGELFLGWVGRVGVFELGCAVSVLACRFADLC